MTNRILHRDLVIEHLAADEAALRELAAQTLVAYHAAVARLADKEINERRHQAQREALVDELRRERAETSRLRALLIKADTDEWRAA